jgi:hypothetical protein
VLVNGHGIAVEMIDIRFEEKQYEQAANIELALRHTNVFSAGQVMESVLGYDTAAHQQASSPIWRILRANPRSGIILVPNLWFRAAAQPPSAVLPTKIISLVIQYKRPEYLSRPNSKQWHYWNQPYFRFELMDHQQRILEAFESSSGKAVVTRYASAAFWKFAELENRIVNRMVLEDSNYVRPNRLIGHDCWTYVRNGIRGYANASPEEIECERFDELFKGLNLAAEETTLLKHLQLVSDQLRQAAPSTARITRDLFSNAEDEFEDLSSERRAGLANLGLISSYAAQASANWFVLTFDN